MRIISLNGIKFMTKEIEAKMKIIALKDVAIRLLDRKLNGEIVPDNVLQVLEDLEEEYKKEF
jgi:hypothetical protein